MALLIDGYNLLHASGVFPASHLPGSLKNARQSLLNFLADRLGPADAARTTIVFDAQEAPPGLPRELRHRGMRVLFAERSMTADEVLERLIQQDHSPRQLVVVSSDHRVQRMARRRRATAIDSDQWMTEIQRPRDESSDDSDDSTDDGKPSAPLHPDDVSRWLQDFSE